MNLRAKRILVRIFDNSIKVGWSLRVMVILSFLYGLFFTIFNFCGSLWKEKTVDYIMSTSLGEHFYFYKQNLLFFFTANRLMYVICFIVGLSIIYGCWLLWRGYKWGLLFYTIGKALQVIIPIMFLGYRMIAIGDILIILLFMVFYYVYSFTHKIEKENRRYTKISIEENKTE